MTVYLFLNPSLLSYLAGQGKKGGNFARNCEQNYNALHISLEQKITVTQCLGVKPYNLHQSPQKFMRYNIVQERYQSVDKLQCNQL